MNRTEVLPGVWHLEEDYRVYCTLVQGKTLALLWDTGQGRTDLAAYVAQQVPTPCLVLNSHGHSDHGCAEAVALRPAQACPFSVTKIETFHDACGGAQRGGNGGVIKRPADRPPPDGRLPAKLSDRAGPLAAG